MKLIYDVSKHPDFIDGKKTKAEILKVFMESFEGGGSDAGDGKITLNEFVNYYTNLGVSIDNEEYFELMIRNAWHMSGGVGAAENSANRRVLVTHADGTQEVVEIKNDLGLEAGDTAGLLQRLSLQGVHASQVTTSSGLDLMSSTTPKVSSAKTLLLSRLASEERARAANSPSKLSSKAPSSPTAGKRSTSAGAFASSIGGLITGDSTGNSYLPKPPAAKSTQIFQDDVSQSGTRGSRSERSTEMPWGIKSLMQRLRAELSEHGARGYHGLQRKFRIMDDDNNGNLSLGEFKKGIRELGLNLVDSEMRALFDHFDFDSSGQISYDAFIQKVGVMCVSCVYGTS
jgi:Ca2+-binding EF-hand superfamily protein